MRVPRRLLHCCALGLAVVALAGCRAGEGDSQKLVYGLTLAPSGIDPHIHASSELGIPLTSVYDTLVFLSPDTGEFVPGLATGWTISDDGAAYTFTLRKAVRFHDGTRFDAAAVKFNLDRVMDPETGSQKARYMLGRLDSVTVEDESTVTIHLAEPYAPLLDSLSQVYLGMASPTAVEKWGDEYQLHQVGAGPFVFAEYVPGDHLLLRRNPDYDWGPSVYEHDTAQVGEIEFRFFTDPATRSPALETGEAGVMGEIPPQDVARLAESDDFRVERTPIPGASLMVFMNTTRPPLDDARVRQALLYGTDRQAIASAVFQPLAAAGISVDTIVQNASIENITDLTFTVAKSHLAKAMEVVKPIANSIGARECASDSKLGKVSIIGTGMQNSPGDTARMVEALSEQGINIQLITTSEIRITCIINETSVEDAVRVLHRAFELEKEE